MICLRCNKDQTKVRVRGKHKGICLACVNVLNVKEWDKKNPEKVKEKAAHSRIKNGQYRKKKKPKATLKVTDFPEYKESIVKVIKCRTIEEILKGLK